MSYGVAGFAEFGLAPSASVSQHARGSGAPAAARGGAVRAAARGGAAGEEYAWEKAYERPWEAIEEDEATGTLITRGLSSRRLARCVRRRAWRVPARSS